MAEGHLIYRLCGWCDGTGERTVIVGDPPGSDTEACPYCDATGAIFWGWMTKDDSTIPDVLQDPPV